MSYNNAGIDDELIGSVLILSEDISNGSGRAKVADSSWRCSGPDLAAGTPVEVIDVKSGTLIVKPAEH